MAQQLTYLAQSAMDLYFGDFAKADDFFTLNDFVYHAANVTGDLYRQEFRTIKAEMRQERVESVVSFSSDWLAEYTFKIEEKEGKPYIPIGFSVLSFPYDNQNTGYQNLFIHFGNDVVEVERASLNDSWQTKFLPTTDRVFWYPVPAEISFFNKSNKILKGREGKLLYVPGISPDMMVPDGIADAVVNGTVQKFKTFLQGNVVDKTNDSNPNKIIQTEINSSNLVKP